MGRLRTLLLTKHSLAMLYSTYGARSQRTITWSTNLVLRTLKEVPSRCLLNSNHQQDTQNCNIVQWNVLCTRDGLSTYFHHNRLQQKLYYWIYSTFTSRRHHHKEKNRCMGTRIYPWTVHLLQYIPINHHDSSSGLPLNITLMKRLSSHTFLLASWGQDVAERGVVLPIDLKWTFYDSTSKWKY